VRLLLDTQVLMWVALRPERIPETMMHLFSDRRHNLAFSVANMWEITVKNGTRRSLDIDISHFRDRLLLNGYEELPIRTDHVLAANALPRLHGDPFDRILIAQAMVEERALVTADRLVLQYPDFQKIAL
jgi:PIN domain nuclease of toxin-antitoxin system